MQYWENWREGAVITEEMQSENAELYQPLRERFDAAQIEVVSHAQFKQQAINAKAFFRTGKTSRAPTFC